MPIHRWDHAGSTGLVVPTGNRQNGGVAAQTELEKTYE